MSRVQPLNDTRSDHQHQHQHQEENLTPDLRNFVPVLDVEETLEAKLIRIKEFPLTIRQRLALKDWISDVQIRSRNRRGCLSRFANCRASFGQNATTFHLWRRSLKSIEALYGTGVASYFIFLRTLFLLNAFLFFLVLCFVILPQALSPNEGEALWTVLRNNSPTTANCSARYIKNISIAVSDGTLPKKILDFLSGTGWMERTILFYGYYQPKNSKIVSGFTYDIPLAYFLVVFFFFVVSLLLILIQTGVVFRRSTLEEKGKTWERYGRIVFSSWDFTVESENSSRQRKRLIYQNIMTELEDEKHKHRHETMTSCQICSLYTCRLIINLVIVALLAGAGFLIYFVQGKSAEYTTQNPSADNFVKLLMEYLPSITITLLGVIYPIIFGVMVGLEDYKTETKVIITLVRTVFVKLFSVVVLVISLYGIVTCSSKDVCNVGIKTCQSIWCWETYVGQQFYKLLLMSFLVTLGVCFGVETPRAFCVKKCTEGGQGSLAEFDTPKNVLEIVYIQILTWFGTAFSPFLPGIAMLILLLLFYIKLFSCYVNCRPANQPYKASRSNFLFLFVLAFAFVLCLIPIGYCVVTLPVSKSCGPFRELRTMYDVIPSTIQMWPTWAKGLFQWIGSAAFVCLLGMTLIALIYYYATLASTRQTSNVRLRQQLVHRAMDLKLLYRQVVAAGQEPRLSERPGRIVRRCTEEEKKSLLESLTQQLKEEEEARCEKFELEFVPPESEQDSII